MKKQPPAPEAGNPASPQPTVEPAGTVSAPPPPPGTAPPLPEPKRYPVTLDNFLCLMFPRLSGRSGQKYAIFRRYLAHCISIARRRCPRCGQTFSTSRVLLAHIRASDGDPLTDSSAVFDSQPPDPPPTKDAVDRSIAAWKANPMPDRAAFQCNARSFLDWYQKDQDEHIISVRSDAGKKSAAACKARAGASKQGPEKAGMEAAAKSKRDKRKGARPPFRKFLEALET